MEDDLKSVLALEAEIAALEQGNLHTGRAEDPVPRRNLEEEPAVTQKEEKEEVEEDLSPEEASFKKRYADLRRGSQQERDKLKEQIEELQTQIRDLKSSTSMPSSMEEARAWAEANPKAAEIIRSLAREQAKSESPREDLQKVKGELDKIKLKTAIMKAHPDFEDIVAEDDFHDWAESKPKRIQDMVYGTDAAEVIWALSEYKKSREKAPNLDKEAAKAVGKSKTAEAPGNGPKAFSESQIELMSPSEYEANEEAIQASIKAGTFVYDLSGGAR